MKAMPKQRYFFKCGWNSRAARPASQSGSVRGCCSSTWALKNSRGDMGRFFHAWALRMNSRVAQSWRNSQTRLGRRNHRAMAPPIQGHLPASSRRSRVSSSPATSAAPKKSMLCLLSSASPARTPNGTQSRWRPLSIMRSSSQAQPIQHSGSKMFME